MGRAKVNKKAENEMMQTKALKGTLITEAVLKRTTELKINPN